MVAYISEARGHELIDEWVDTGSKPPMTPEAPDVAH